MYKTADRVQQSPRSRVDYNYSVRESMQLPLGENSAEHFFVGASSSLVPDLLSFYLPSMRASIIESAEQVCAGKFHTLGYGRLHFSPANNDKDVNWHLDAISGKTAPLTHWSRINPLDFATVGDSKVVWELNRHQWMVQLGLAWKLTGDEKYANVFVDRLQSWMQDNPPGFGINWSSSLEVSYRLISWCWAIVLFQRSTSIPSRLMSELTPWIQAHADHIQRYLSVYYSPNTHLTGEALGLFYAGTLFPQLPGAQLWRNTGHDILLAQLQRQVFDDGVYFEQSTHYQCYTIEIYLHFMILARRSGRRLPRWVSTRIESMLDFMLDIRRPDGTVPQIGDNDGGSLLPIVHRETGDLQALFSVAAVLFNRSDYAWASGGSSPELLCLLGPAGHYALLAIKPTTPNLSLTALFDTGGYVVMRNSWHTRGHHLIMDTGPLGCPDSAAHGHADLLAIQCSAFGENYLVDPGTDNYTADPLWRDHFRNSGAHNTITIDDTSQSVPSGPFSWQGKRPIVKLRHFETSPLFTIADASHDGWMKSNDPVLHRRRIIFVRQSYWIVVDDLLMQKAHDVALNYQFTPGTVNLEANGWIRAFGRKSGALLMHVRSSCESERSLVEGQAAPPRGWVSDNYGQRRPAPALRISARSTVPVRIYTVLMPVASAQTDVPELDITTSKTHADTDYLTVTPHAMLADNFIISEDDFIMSSRINPCAE